MSWTINMWFFPDRIKRVENKPQVPEARNLVRQAEPLFSQGLDTYEAGGMLGLILDLKPACIINNGNNFSEAELESFFKSRGREVIFQDRLIIDVKSLTARLKSDIATAKLCGWEDKLSLTENIRQASGLGAASIKAQALTGFLLGFPESALRAYMHYRALAEKGVPNLRELCTCPDVLEVGAWRPAERKLVEEIQARCLALDAELEHYSDVKIRNAMSEQLFFSLKESYRSRIINLYRTRYQIPDGEINFLFNLEAVEILSPEDEAIFIFKDSCPQNQEPEDVRNLRQKVSAAFG